MRLDRIKALIFDIGGTLYRPVSDMCSFTREFLEETETGDGREYSNSAIRAALKEPDEWLTEYMIKNDVDVHWQPKHEHWLEYDRILLETLGVQDSNVVQQYQAKWDKFLEGSRPEIIEGCCSELERFHAKGFKLAIASNRFSDPTNILQEDSILHLFDVIEYSNVPGYKKPSPYLLLRVAEQLGINPRRCAYIGNIVEFDVIAAERAEMIPILLTWVDTHEIHKITSDVIAIEHVADLIDIL
ncbi:HAD family hydrolase [Candidatus Thorarchaeota archaeon]|nr:MAG: HAD family hydrolase [Candidatus Thorarchaeota archaeon]